MKCAAAALFSAAICLLIKRTNPEISILLSAAAIVVIVAAALHFAQGLRELTAMIKNYVGGANMYIAPVLKCVGIGAVTKIGVELCRDASQSSTAAAVDLAGTLCAIGVALPLVVSMLKLIGGMT